MDRRFTGGRGVALAVASAAFAACAYQVGYQPDYVPPERPPYVADGKLLIVMPEAQRQLVYEGAPATEVGSFTKITIPFGTIMQDIAAQVFNSCFARGVEFAENREAASDYVLALEADLGKFFYSYTRVIDEGFSVEEPTTWLVPQVRISLDVRAYDPRGIKVLEKTYDSGVAAGEQYTVDSKPAERINETLHETLTRLMLQVANDIRPLLVGECDIRDLAPG
jgi:hypothetical protein